MAALQRRASVAAYAGIFPASAAQPSVAELLARWCDQLIGADGRAWPLVLEVEEEVVGGVLARETRENDATGEIWGLYVDPAHWGNGYGPLLLAGGTARLAEAGLSEAILWVLEANARARTLYERAGWAADGASRPAQAAPGILQLRYRRPLP